MKTPQETPLSPLERLPRGRLLAGLAFVSLLALLPGAGSPSQLMRGDVYRYVLRVATAMFETGDWLVPRLGGSIDFSKPPLFHWLVAASLGLVRDPFLASRLPGLLCSAATVLLTYQLARLAGLSRTRSAFAGLMWLGSAAMAVYGRQPLLEAPITACLLLSYYGLARACLRRQGRWLLLFGLGVGASSMVKWVAGPLTAGVFAAAYLALTGRWRWLLERPGAVAASLAVAAAVALPWPLAILALHRDFFLAQLHSEIFAQRYKSTTGVLDFLGRGVALGLLPWLPLLAPALGQVKRLHGEARWLTAAVLAAGLVPTLLISARTSRYAYPALPALLIAVAALARPEERPWRAAFRGTGLLAALGFAAAFAACARLGALPAWAAALCAAAAAWTGLQLWRGRALPGAAGAAACFALLAGPGAAGFGFNVVPAQARAAMENRTVLRYVDDPESASTASLQTYLRRTVGHAERGGLGAWVERRPVVVVSGRAWTSLREEAASLGLKPAVLAEWTAPHNNPPARVQWEALRAGSRTPALVEHRAVELAPAR